ncbi:MAG: hypothetical protein ABIG96_04650 [Candidatus Micrarchaeota archaeon]
MAITDVFNALPRTCSIIAFFISIMLMFWGLRYFTFTDIDNIGRLLAYTIPGIWMMGFSIYLWIIGEEDRRG